MSSTRDQILKTILSRQRCSINDLADVVGINPISVRHHIIKLQAEGVIDSEEERHGIGRPRRMYFLTKIGQEKFPTHYLRLTNHLLEQMKNTLPPDALGNLFSQMGKEMAEDFTGSLEMQQLPIEKRLDILVNVLQKEGFNVTWQRQGDKYLIKELTCPYYHIGQSHPEICAIDQSLISIVLSVPAKKIQCILDGDSICTYVVPALPLSDIDVIEPQTQEKK